LQPYTAPTLVELARQGIKTVDVMCPGFTVDCLETLEEIAQEGRDDFLGAGGTTFNYIPCLNDTPPFIAALADLVQAHMAGWPTSAPEVRQYAERLMDARAQALQLGAKN
jgi:ferrochelatase